MTRLEEAVNRIILFFYACDPAIINSSRNLLMEIYLHGLKKNKMNKKINARIRIKIGIKFRCML